MDHSVMYIMELGFNMCNLLTLSQVVYIWLVELCSSSPNMLFVESNEKVSDTVGCGIKNLVEQLPSPLDVILRMLMLERQELSWF